MQKIEQLLELKRLYLERMVGSVFLDLEPIKPSHIQSYQPENLEELSTTISQCRLCDLSKTKGMPNSGYTPQNPQIAFVLETPITTLSNSSILTTRSGEMLQDMIKNVLEIPLTQVSFLSVLKCHPPLGQDIQEEHIQLCLPYLFNQLLAIQPKIIVTLGETATKAFFKTDGSFQQIRGTLQTWESIPLIALYSPRILLRNPSLKKTTMRDLMLIKSLIIRNQ